MEKGQFIVARPETGHPIMHAVHRAAGLTNRCATVSEVSIITEPFMVTKRRKEEACAHLMHTHDADPEARGAIARLRPAIFINMGGVGELISKTQTILLLFVCLFMNSVYLFCWLLFLSCHSRRL